ncbi:hypothetical protein F5B22DRAFT_653411 [Xylaria bambusicola]|uniref:uncharacterized protein n=1 Tax=Xylaria bambusicola TaxID=326684 RepID=UPI002007E672|nr:uncharacterized protein F5B22DRAFT_653411 [Xylaria bambusicola]KAI0520984.1 hypothetical protein F5B22DRAFT_653411 [Xylaria bambusicola]
MRDGQQKRDSKLRGILAGSQLTDAFEFNQTSDIPSDRQFCKFEAHVTPAGVLKAVMDLGEDAQCLAFTLPRNRDWKATQLNTTARLAFYPFDINCLAADMGAFVTGRPGDPGSVQGHILEFIQEPSTLSEPDDLVVYQHPHPWNFSVAPLFTSDEKLDLIMCDARFPLDDIELKETMDIGRTQLVQLALGLEHVKEGGKMIIRLSDIESWTAVDLLYTFTQFSYVDVFKHASTGTRWPDCYLLASNIRPLELAAITSVHRWKKA